MCLQHAADQVGSIILFVWKRLHSDGHPQAYCHVLTDQQQRPSVFRTRLHSEQTENSLKTGHKCVLYFKFTAQVMCKSPALQCSFDFYTCGLVSRVHIPCKLPVHSVYTLFNSIIILPCEAVNTCLPLSSQYYCWQERITPMSAIGFKTLY